MATQVTNYQCPSCTGPLHFAGGSGMLECEYCGSRYSVEEVEKLYAEKEQKAQQATEKQREKEQAQGERGEGWDFAGAGGDWGDEAGHMRAYNCPSCGAELICDETTAATSCPYCGNPSIVPGQFGGALKPDYIIPFKLDKEAAKKALKEHYKGKKLLPKVFKDENKIDEIKGVYVPFWLFDGEADADATFHATRSHSHREGDEEVTVTEHYQIRRAGTVGFQRIPVDASTKMPDAHMDSIEPFDYSELKAFSTAYLPGYLADKYDVSAEECSKRAGERCEATAIQAMERSVTGYATVTTENSHVRLRKGTVKYAMLPVWMLSTKWNDRNFLFAMNGQTGKLIGDLPVSWGRFWAWFAAISAPLMAVLAAIFLF